MAKKKDKAFSGKTHVMFILDESGSMNAVWDQTIDGFNEWLNQMKQGGDIWFTLIKFDTEYRPLEQNVPIKDVDVLDRNRYAPTGMTALYDAIGYCVKVVEKQVEKKDRALVVILTDGQENSSREMNRASVTALIEKLEKQGNWTFTYLSAAPSAFADAQTIGIQQGNTASFNFTPSGTKTAMRGVASATMAYASAGASASTGFYSGVQTDERDDEPKRRAPKIKHAVTPR